MSPNRKTVILIVVAVVIFVGIIWYALLEGLRPLPGTTSAPLAQPGAVAFAPEGELVAGFPKQLIFDNGAAMNGSYSINYSSSTNQYTAAWNSSSSMESLYEAYGAYLPAHGWTILNDVTKFPTSRGLYARNASSDVSVAIIAQRSGSQVIVTYLAR